MATRGLLRHPLHARPPSYITDPRHLLPRRPSFPSDVIAFRRRLSSMPTLRSVKCMKVEDQTVAKADVRDTPPAQLDVVDYVNKVSPGPMVEVDPVTVFRRIIAERRASLAMARAKQEVDNIAFMQSMAPQPFILGSKWSGKSSIAIALALVLLVLAAVSYILRSRTDREKQTALTLTEGKDNLDISNDNVRRKLVKDTIKAPENVLTAMAIGAASVGKSKGHTGSSHDSMHAGNGNLADTQVSFKPSNIQAFGSFKTHNAGVDGTEGPWFAQAADDAGNSRPDSSNQSASAAQDVLEDALSEKQEVHVSAEAIINKVASEISVNEVRYETLPLNNVVDGEFLGEVVSCSVATEDAVEVSDNSPQVENFKFEEPEDDVDLADSSAIVEKLEQMIGQESITPTEDKNLVGKASVPTLELPNDRTGEMDMGTEISDTDSYSDDSENDEQHKVTQSFSPLEVDKVASLEESDSEVNDEGLGTSCVDVEEIGNTMEWLSTELDNVSDDAHLSVDNSEAGKVGEAISVGPSCSHEEVASWTTHEPLSASQTSEELQTDANFTLNQATNQDSGAMTYGLITDAALQPLEEDSREDNKKALEAALPALAIGVGTVGTLFGVAGGLQVVGFAAIASFLSQDFFWAQSRAELCQELKGITNRQKLMDFLARRNIVRNDQEE